MITAEQIKDIKERVDALHHYLAIDDKKIQLEEEELKTQAFRSSGKTRSGLSSR